MFALFFLTLKEQSSTSWDTVIHPDPENCQNYYLCDTPDICTLESCDPYLLFDDVLLTCNFPNAVDCGDRPNPLETTIHPEKSTTTEYNPTTSNKITSTTITIPPSKTGLLKFHMYAQSIDINSSKKFLNAELTKLEGFLWIAIKHIATEN